MARPKEKLPEFLGGKSGNRTITTLDPKTLQLRTEAEQLVLAKLIERADAIFAWIDEKMAKGTLMSDKPMVDMLVKLLSMAVPDRRQVEASTPQQQGRGGALTVIVNNPAIRRGTKKARDRAIEMRKAGANGYAPETPAT